MCASRFLWNFYGSKYLTVSKIKGVFAHNAPSMLAKSRTLVVIISEAKPGLPCHRFSCARLHELAIARICSPIDLDVGHLLEERGRPIDGKQLLLQAMRTLEIDPAATKRAWRLTALREVVKNDKAAHGHKIPPALLRNVVQNASQAKNAMV